MPVAAQLVVTWKLEQLKTWLDAGTDKALLALALQIEGQAKINITANGQVDTGFMRASVYAVGRDYNGKGAAEGDADSHDTSSKTGATVAHSGQFGAGESAQPQEALVIVGANYAADQEARRAFLYPAAQSVAGSSGGVVSGAFAETGT